MIIKTARKSPGFVLMELLAILTIGLVLTAGYLVWRSFRQPPVPTTTTTTTTTPTIGASPTITTTAVVTTSLPTPKITPQPVLPKVTPPAEFAFTNTVEIPGIGVRAKLPENVTVHLHTTDFYSAEAGAGDSVTFLVKDYNGGGRRAWFKKEYRFYQDYAFEPFETVSHRGYLAYQANTLKNLNNFAGLYFYFTTLTPTKMLVIQGSNNINGSVFFGGNLDKFKSFVSAVELIPKKEIQLETPSATELYRFSSTRKTIWQDENLGLKITSPEWVESRYTRYRDVNGNYIYSDWYRVLPEAKEDRHWQPSNYQKSVDVTGGYMGVYLRLFVLATSFNQKSFDEVTNELLLPSGFCAQGWKVSKDECESELYCYTREEVTANLLVRKSIQIGSLRAQLRGLNEEFSIENDCRAEDEWLIKAKNDQYVTTTIDLSPEGKAIQVEAL